MNTSDLRTSVNGRDWRLNVPSEAQSGCFILYESKTHRPIHLQSKLILVTIETSPQDVPSKLESFASIHEFLSCGSSSDHNGGTMGGKNHRRQKPDYRLLQLDL
ncbi:hypothetical protein EVAR_52787_1 [Eumeta japonica]|uniref:Uncharacterized protein n=1 Tax=Eumeta variegata TaxID=151549 RepID=A0A4C1Z7C8_EUMVA|nr:hypothetical protein EVAR_52787_1 [Eumeta japonica]